MESFVPRPFYPVEHVRIFIDNTGVLMELPAVKADCNLGLQCRKVILQHLIEVYNLAVYVIYDFNF